MSSNLSEKQKSNTVVLRDIKLGWSVLGSLLSLMSVGDNLSRKIKIKKLFFPPFLASALLDTGVSSVGRSSLRQFIPTDKING